MSFHGYDMPGHALMDASHAASRWGAKADGNARGGNPSIQGATVTVNGVRISPRAGMLRPEQVPPVMVPTLPAVSSPPPVVAAPSAPIVRAPIAPAAVVLQHDSASAYHSLRDAALSAIRGEPMAKAYPKLAGRIKFAGMEISVETDKGQERRWIDPHTGESGSTKMLYPYGYIRRTEGADGEHVDAYVGPNEQAKNVYIVHQMKAPDFKDYDEDKTMLGFSSEWAARSAYLAHYNDKRFLGSVSVMPVDQFRRIFLHGTDGTAADMAKGIGGVGFHEEPIHMRRIGTTQSGRVAWLAKSPGDLAYDGCTRDDHMQISDLHWRQSEKATAARAMAKSTKESEHALTLYAHHRRLAYDHIVAATKAPDVGNNFAAALL